jgi:ATP synthase protein I
MEEQTPQSPKKKQSPTDFAKYSAMGLQMAAIMGGSTYLGYKLDGWLHLHFPLFTLILSLTGVFAALWYFIKDFLKKK